MFVLGFLVALVLVAGVVWWLGSAEPTRSPGLDAQRELLRIERQAIDQMLRAELEARAANPAAYRRPISPKE